MNKKLARAVRQRRKKEIDQNRRRLKKETDENRRQIERRNRFRSALRGYRLDDVDEERYETIAKNCRGEICSFCEKKIFKKDLKAKRFLAMTTNRSRAEYVFHHHHLFEEDLQTKKAEAGAVLQEIYNKIFRIEFREFEEFLNMNG